MNSVSSSTSSLSAVSDAAIGYGGIYQKTVDCSVKVLIQSLASFHLKLVGEMAERLQKDSECYKSKDAILPFRNGSIQIPHSVIDAGLCKEERYYAKMKYQISELREDIDHPLYYLLILLKIQIAKFGCPCDAVEVRFEKGCMADTETHWHRDDKELKHAISLCFSNRENWALRILSEQSEILEDQIESRSQPSRFGYFYDAKKTLHRAPLIGDLNDQNIAAGDYHLFIHFYGGDAAERDRRARG